MKKKKKMRLLTMNSSSKTLLPLYFLLCLLCLFTAYNHTSTSPLSLSENKFFFNLKAHDNDIKNIKKSRNILEKGRGARRVLLGGPGSSPPRCTSKCGRCTPCNAVHVAVPPGARVTMEYYPEAWRCKCGNKLYMP